PAHTAAAGGGVGLPTLGAIGLGPLTRVAGVAPADAPAGAVARMVERSAAKDTTTGPWEMMGVVAERPAATIPNTCPAPGARRAEGRGGARKPARGGHTDHRRARRRARRHRQADRLHLRRLGVPDRHPQ